MRPLWADPRVGGAGTWTATTGQPRTRLTLLGTTVLCFILTAAFLGVVTAGRTAMCATHNNQLRYCPGYTSEQTRPTTGATR